MTCYLVDPSVQYMNATRIVWEEDDYKSTYEEQDEKNGEIGWSCKLG